MTPSHRLALRRRRDAPWLRQSSSAALAASSRKRARARRRGRVERTRSCSRSECRMPKADSVLALPGKTTRSMPSSSATATACRPAAPPKASSTKSRGSRPFSNSDSRIAAPRLALVTASSPSAAASADETERRGDVGIVSTGVPPPRRAACSPPRKPCAPSLPERHVRVRHGRLACRRGRSRTAPAARRRFRGPTVSRPPARTLAIDPPPAPMVRISTIGSRTGIRSISPCVMRLTPAARARRTRRSWCHPCRSRRGCRSPSTWPSSAQAELPPDGPESRSRTGSLRGGLERCTRRRSTARAGGAACKPSASHAPRELIEVACAPPASAAR